MKVERITAPGIPNPAPDEATHEAHRSQLALPRDTDPAYQELLELLRRDLQLDPAVDLIPPSDGGYNQGIQAGRSIVSLTAGAIGAPVATNFKLPHAWPHSHDAFVAVVISGPVWPTYYGSDTNGAGYGTIWLSASANGNYVVNWFSKGH